MDLQMPLMDGFEATHAIRNGEAGNKAKSIKIIALTANALSGDRDRCLDAGMDAYLSKPIKISILKKCIAALFDEPENSFLKEPCRYASCTVVPMIKKLIERTGPMMNVIPSQSGANF